MTFDNPKQADALCTVIALGFIKIANRQKYIIYLDGKDDAAETDRHNQLKDTLNRLDIPLEFNRQTTGDKPLQPVILAHTSYTSLQKDILDEYLYNLSRLEDRVDKYADKYAKSPLRGAYIGGALFSSKAELLDPSILYRYDPAYRKTSQDVDESYEKAELVSQTVDEFLDSEFSGGQSLYHKGIRLYRPEGRSLKSAKSQISGLFGSVHGMTQSIIHYFRTTGTDKVLVELALSKDTCKVASCIPCSIFMWANGTPASATHFGRGDNWNFPNNAFEQIRKCSGPDHLKPLDGYPYAKAWMETVWAAYDAGASCLIKHLGTAPSLDLAYVFQLDHNYIPQMFLEALTFESSFIDKMFHTLNVK